MKLFFQKLNKRLLLLLTVAFFFTNCLWDNDTLEMERQKFPGSLELITGKFLHHSKEFYEWKIADRYKKIRQFPDSADLYDDLAVAFCKTGKINAAISWMKRKEKLWPGMYTTYSNMGTFYMLQGKWKEGIPCIDRALMINPEAHFGREKYQKYLAEYVLSKMKNGKTVFPLNSKGFVTPNYRLYDEVSFRSFLE
jgi:tetratricopeptide (TPR) repeat protein